MVRSASYRSSTGSSIVISMTDGTVWYDDASLPPDTDIRRQLAEWLADGNVISPFASTLDDLRAAKLAAITSAANALLAAGAPATGGLHVALDDGSRSDLTAMAATASAAASGAVSWPESYARGWIAVENVRIPLPTPAAGLALVASVGGWQAAVVQHRRELKDAALTAGDAAALDAIDETAGWPAA